MDWRLRANGRGLWLCPVFITMVLLYSGVCRAAPGDLVWSYALPSYSEIFDPDQPSLSAQGQLVVPTPGGLIALNATSGRLTWKYETNHPFNMAAVADDGTIYAPNDDNHLYCFDKNGNLQWKFHGQGAQISSKPALMQDGDIIFSTIMGDLYRLNPDGQSYEWKVLFDFSIQSSPSIGPDGTIYITGPGPCWDGLVYAFYPNGTLRWKTENGHYTSSPALDDDSNLYLNNSNDLISLDASNGTRNWACPGNGAAWRSPVVGPSGVVYAIDNDRGLTAVDTTSLSIAWAFAKDGVTLRGDPAVGPDGTVYAVGSDGLLYAVGSGGTLQWTFDTQQGAGGYWHGPLVGPDGTVYFVFNNRVFAVEGAGSGTIDAPWPMFGGSWDRQSRYRYEPGEPVLPTAVLQLLLLN